MRTLLRTMGRFRSSMGRVGAAGFVAGLLLATPVPAVAAPPTPQVKALFKAGAQAYEQGQFLKAIEAFEAAHALDARPQLLFSAAAARRRQYAIDRKIEHLKKALEYYRLYLKEVPEGGRRIDAAKAVEQLQPQLDRLGGDGATEAVARRATRLMISSSAESATIAIDGGKPQYMPYISKAKPGKHTITVSAKGYRPLTREVVAVKGAVVALEIELKPQLANLGIKGGRGRLSVNGEDRGQLPRSMPLQLSAGRHRLSVLANGAQPYTRVIQLERGAKKDIDVQLASTSLRKASFVVLAGGGLGLVAGGVLGLLALNKEAEATELADARAQGAARTLDDLSAYNQALQARNDLRLTSGIIAGTAAVFSAVGLILYLFDAPVAPPMTDVDRLDPKAPPADKPKIELSASGLRLRF